MTELTEIEQAVVIFIHGHLAQNQYAPSYDEIAAAIARSRSTASEIIHTLQSKDWLRFDANEGRTIRLWFQYRGDRSE